MNELEKLLSEKRKLEERIRQLKTGGIIVVDGAKLDKEHYPTQKPDEWMVSVMTKSMDTQRREQWRSIIRGTDRKAVMLEIDSVIVSLENLRTEMKKEVDE